VAAFKFRLAPVLRFRERMKQQREWEMKDLLAQRSRIEDALRALHERLARTGETLAAAEGQIVSPLELRLHGEYAQQLSRQINEQKRVLDACNQTIAAKRQELVEAARAVKVLEQLRARLQEKFAREQRITDQKLTDEATHIKFGRRERGK
jgi:flagellar export protein FliJ